VALSYESVRVPLRALGTAKGSDAILELLEDRAFAVLGEALDGGLEARAISALAGLFREETNTKVECRAPRPRDPGYSEYGRARALDTGIPNLLESWRFGRGHGEVLPPGHGELSELMRDLDGALFAILMLSLESLGTHVPAWGGLPRFVTRDSCELYGLSYPGSLLGRVPGARRQSVHSDSSVVTLLPRASGPGLEVGVGDKLVPFEVRGGDVLLLAGSALEYLTGGRIRACLHTVGTPASDSQDADRVAIVYFGSAASNATLHVLSADEGSAGGNVPSSLSVRDFEIQGYASAYRSEEAGGDASREANEK
jgi:hypothetical protein